MEGEAGKLHGMGFSRARQLHPSLTSPSVMQNLKSENVGCSGVKLAAHWTLEQWRHLLWSDELHFAVRQCTTSLGLEVAQENGSCLTALCQV